MNKAYLTLISCLVMTSLLKGQTFTDTRDGNVYKTVTIGNQTWMAENLKYLPEVKGSLVGSSNDIEKYYYVYGYEGTDTAAAKLTSTYNTYGVLYNFAAATNGKGFSYQNNPIQGACPTGWHLPIDTEWTELNLYIGAYGGGKLKAGGTSWNFPNSKATNETGFTALPGGLLNDNTLSFSEVGTNGYWWCSSFTSGLQSYYAYAARLFHNDSIFYNTYYYKSSGFSVRCIKTVCDLNLNLDTSSGSQWICHNPGADFQWLFSADNVNFSPIQGYSIDSTYTPTQNGYYAVKIVKGLCTDTSNAYLFQGATGTNNIKTNTYENLVQVYPNPIKEILNIDLQGNQQDVNVFISDLTGRIVGVYYFKNRQKFNIDLKHLTVGVYNITIKSKDFSYSSRIIKE